MDSQMEPLITAQKFTNPTWQNTPVLYPEQLVMDALRVMVGHGGEGLSICENGKCLGVIYLRDLERFLYEDGSNDDLFFHKLNFDLRSALVVMNRQINQLAEVL
jgi:hypothetical protein